MPRITFRIRTLLVLLLVALPPLVAFGIFAVASTVETASIERAQRAHEGAQRARAILANALHQGHEAIRVVAADRAFAEFALTAEADPTDVRDRYSALAGASLPGWSVGLETTDGITRLDASSPGMTEAQADLPTSAADTASGGVRVAAGRIGLVVSSPLTAAVEGADELSLIAWRDATNDLLPQLSAAADGAVAIDAGGELVVTGERSAALVDALRITDQPSEVIDASESGADAAHAVIPIDPVDGTSGRLAVLPDQPSSELSTVGLSLALSVAGSLAVLWAVLLAAAFARSIGGELRRLAEAAERVREGDFGTSEIPAGGDELGRLAGVHARLAASIQERNRQIGELAEQVASLPVGENPAAVAIGVAEAAASVTGEAIWSVAILRSAPPEALRPGRYGGPTSHGGTAAGHETPAELSPWVEGAWRSLTSAVGATDRGRLVETPEGPFVTVLVAAEESLDAVLLAPWAGRPEPSGADWHLFTLLARHASTAIEHALLYTRLHAQAEELERMASVQADFLRGVSHDLQTPLTSISVLSSDLRARVDVGSTATADLQSIEEQAERLRRMVAQLLVVSRLEAGAVTPRQEVFRPRPVVERTWQALRPTDRSLEITVVGQEHLVVADTDRLEQVLWALLENAVRYGGSGTSIGVRIAGRPRREVEDAVTAAAAPSEFVSEIEVVDHGIGMDDETRQHAFDQFYRSEAARALVPDGSGIGLYAARGLVTAMGGTLTVSSRLGLGSTFRISLPAEPAAPAEESVVASGSAPGSRPESRRSGVRPSRPGCSAAGSTPRTAR